MLFTIIKIVIELVIAWFLFDVYLAKRTDTSPFKLTDKSFGWLFIYVLGWALIIAGCVNLMRVMEYYADILFIELMSGW